MSGAAARGRRTFIVTSRYRSGTSLVASILQQAGIFMGRQINDAVLEDEEMGAILTSGDAGALLLFWGLTSDAALRERLIGLVEPKVAPNNCRFEMAWWGASAPCVTRRMPVKSERIGPIGGEGIMTGRKQTRIQRKDRKGAKIAKKKDISALRAAAWRGAGQSV